MCGEKAEGNFIVNFFYFFFFFLSLTVLIEAHHILQLLGCCIQGVVTYMSRGEVFATGIQFSQAINALFGGQAAIKSQWSYMWLQFDL